MGISSATDTNAMVVRESDEEVQDVCDLVSSRALVPPDLHVDDRSKQCADLLLKLMMVSSSIANIEDVEGVDDVGKGVCCAFNGMLARILTKKIHSHDANVLRDMISASRQMLEDVLRNAVKEGVDGTEDNRLTISMVDLLKSAFNMSGIPGDSREYSRKCRSRAGQANRDSCTIMKEKRPYELQAYATGEQMRDNFNSGLDMLDKLKDKDDSDLLDIIAHGSQGFSTFMHSFLLATVLDNQRMKAASIISARIYGDFNEDPSTVFGSADVLGLVFDSCSSLVSITRTVTTICALMTMSYCSILDHHLCENMAAGLSRPEAKVKTNKVDAPSSPYCKTINEFLALGLIPIINRTLNANPSKPDAPGTNTAIYNFVAEWFEKAVRDPVKTDTLKAAFQFRGFKVNTMHPEMKKMWDEFKKLNGVDESTTSVDLFFAADFLCFARLQLHDNNLCGTNLFMTSMMVFSGSIATLMEPTLSGPFKFDDCVTSKTERLVKKIFNNDPRLCKFTDESSRKRPEKENNGKTCKATLITNKILERGRVRAQNDKSVMMDTRLSVCLFMLALSEELKKDISQDANGLHMAKPGARYLVSEGRKDGRRIYVIALETLPNANFAHRREDLASHLIEKSRTNPDQVETTGDNTEKPFRDIVGGAVINTILYPLAGISFVYALQDIVLLCGERGHVNKHGKPDEDYYFKSTTVRCVNQFIAQLEDRVQHAFDVRSIMPESDGPVRVGLDECKEVFQQQKSFANRVCEVLKDCGTLWEDLQLSFAVQKNLDGDDRDLSDKLGGQTSSCLGEANPPAELLSILERPAELGTDSNDDDDWAPELQQVGTEFDQDDVDDCDDSKRVAKRPRS